MNESFLRDFFHMPRGEVARPRLEYCEKRMADCDWKSLGNAGWEFCAVYGDTRHGSETVLFKRRK
jgi:hypothetical protein